MNMRMAVPAAAIDLNPVDAAITRATSALLAKCHTDGHWCFELEADATISSEYILLRHFRGDPASDEIEAKIANYLRRTQGAHGGWALLFNGPFDISASVKAYFALKMIGDSIDAPHMVRARDAIHAYGGAERSNVFTRSMLALYDQMPWTGVPVMPVEIMLLPKWFPFHLDKVSYWARTTIVPMLILQTLKPKPVNARKIDMTELFVTPPDKIRTWPRGAHTQEPWTTIFEIIDRILHVVSPHFPSWTRAKAMKLAEEFTIERLNGPDGLGAIYPSMAFSLLMFDVLGYPKDHPHVLTVKDSIERLLVIKDHEAYCQPCVSPVWDTALTCHTLLEVGGDEAEAAAKAGLDWLKPRQVLDVKGDWAAQKPDLRPGGWAFQYANAHYPDLDDTAVVVMAMDRAEKSGGAPAETYTQSIARAREWVEGMQSRNGGWGAFDADNDKHYLNNIPFADHGALLDPPTEDVSARCISMLAQLGETPATNTIMADGLAYLRKTQLADGSWYGRWGLNYIYGTWSVLCALKAVDDRADDDAIKRACDWLISIQNADGGWGEGDASYALDYKGYTPAPSTPSQTAWALLALMAGGAVEHESVRKGMAWLMDGQADDGLWPEEIYTGTGFPRIFYLRYHGYAKFFPIWAMARYRNLLRSNARNIAYGM